MDNRDSSHEQPYHHLTTDFDVDMQSSSETPVVDSSTATTSQPASTYQQVGASAPSSDDMPALIEVSDSESESEDDDGHEAREVEMQPVPEVTPTPVTAPRLPTFDFRRGFLNRPAGDGSLSARSSTRRARVDEDEDAERDRRHPSQRVSTSAAAGPSTSAPHPHAFAHTPSGVFPLPAHLTQSMGTFFESLFPLPRSTNNQAARTSPDNNSTNASRNSSSSATNTEASASGSSSSAQPESLSSGSQTTLPSSSSEPALSQNPAATNDPVHAVPPAFTTRSNIFGVPMNFRMRALPDGGIALSGVAVNGEEANDQAAPSAAPPATNNTTGDAPVPPTPANVNNDAPNPGNGNPPLPPPRIRPGLNIGIALGLAGLPGLAFGPPPPPPPQPAANGPQNAGVPAGGNAGPAPLPGGFFGPGGPTPPAMNLPPFMGGQFNFNLGGFNFGDLMEEKEDPERAKKLVEGLEEVPVGLVRRLERVGGMGGGMGESEDKGGDGGCAICWERLLIEDEVIEEKEEGAEKVDTGKHKVTVEEVPDPDAPVEEDIVMQASESSTVEEKESKEPTSKYPKIVSLPCAHVFHADCLIPWFSRPRHTTCPTCRFNIDPDNLTYVSRRQRERERRARERAERGEPAEEEGEQEEEMFDDERGRNFMVDMLHLIASGARLREAVARRGGPPAAGNQAAAPQDGSQDAAAGPEPAQNSTPTPTATSNTATPPAQGETQTPQGAVNIQYMPIPIVVPVPIPATGAGPRNGSAIATPQPGASEQSQAAQPGDYPLIVVLPPLGPGTYVISHRRIPSFVVNMPTVPLRPPQAQGMATPTGGSPTPAAANAPQQPQGPSPRQQARPTPSEYLATMALHELLWPGPRPRRAHPPPPPTGQPPFPWDMLFGTGPMSIPEAGPQPGNTPDTAPATPAAQPAPQNEGANNNNNNTQPFTQVVQVSFDVLFPGLPLPGSGGNAAGAAPPPFNFRNINANVLNGDLPAGVPPANDDGDMVVVMEGILGGEGGGDDHPAPATVEAEAAPAQPAPAPPQVPQNTFQQQLPRFLEHLFGVAAGPPAGPATAGVGGIGGMTLGQLLRAMREGQPGQAPNPDPAAAQASPEATATATAAGPTPAATAAQPQPGTAPRPPAPGVTTGFRTFNNINELMEAVPILGGAGGGPAGARPNQPAPQFPIGSETLYRRRNRQARRETRSWSPPPPPGLTLRERIEKKEREAGLRCYDVSCCLAPTDDDEENAELVAPMKQLSIKAKDKSEVCIHRFHNSCLVTSERVALKGADVVVEDGAVEVTCPVCRHVGSVTQQEWDEGVQALL